MDEEKAGLRFDVCTGLLPVLRGWRPHSIRLGEGREQDPALRAHLMSSGLQVLPEGQTRVIRAGSAQNSLWLALEREGVVEMRRRSVTERSNLDQNK